MNLLPHDGDRPRDRNVAGQFTERAYLHRAGLGQVRDRRRPRAHPGPRPRDRSRHTLDPEEVHILFTAMEPMDEMMHKSSHFGTRVTVPDDADEQTKLIAFSARRP